MRKVLITGAAGQIGVELALELQERYGAKNVVATDLRAPVEKASGFEGVFEFMDVLDPHSITRVMQLNVVGSVYHLAAILSATAESKPNVAWQVNINGLYNLLEAARQYHCSLFFPSSIGAFGTTTPKENTPQDTIQRPDTIYGVTKVTGELLCDYYHKRFGLDTRGLRFPGLISYAADPGGGTTDYAVSIFYDALRFKKFTCYLKPDTRLDMMYMPDAIRAMVELMEAEPNNLVHRNAFNITAMNFTPEELAREIRKHIPDFRMEYEVDPGRQAIADTWPSHMDDACARKEWGWKPEYNLSQMALDMIKQLSKKLALKV